MCRTVEVEQAAGRMAEAGHQVNVSILCSVVCECKDTTWQLYDSLFEFWVPGVCLSAVSALGLVGNLLSALVLTRPAMSR